MKLNRILMGSLTTVASLAVAVAASAQSARSDAQAQRGQFSDKDYRFIEKAAAGGAMEVQMGQLAAQKGASQAVRDFGQRMVTDHSKAAKELKQLVTQKGAMLPAQMSHHEESTMKHLQSLTGADFDKAYSKDMVSDHRKDVKDFQKEAGEVTDPDLRAWAQKTLPVLQQHLQLAQQMETTVKSEK